MEIGSVQRIENTGRIELFDLDSVQSVVPESTEEEEFDYPDGGLRAYLVLFGCFAGLTVCLGFVNSIGAIQSYVSNHQLAYLPASSVSWMFSIYLCLTYGTGIFIGSLFDKKGAFWLLVVATSLLFAGLMIVASSVKIWHFILGFIAMGVGNGVGVVPLISVINHWFFKKRGMCIGFATMGGSVGGVMFPSLLKYLYVKYGFMWAIRIVAFVCLACMSTSVVLVKERITRDPKESTKFSLQKLTSFNWSESFRNINLKFWFLATGAFVGEVTLGLIVTYFPSYAIVNGVSESDSYLLLTVWNATGILGRIVPGYISDKFGRFNINILMLLGLNLCILVIWLPFGHFGRKLLYCYAAFGGFCASSVLSMFPTCLAQITRANELGKKYSIINAFASFGNLVIIPLGASITNKGTRHNYDMFVVLVAMFSVLGTTFWMLSRFMIVGMKLNVKV